MNNDIYQIDFTQTFPTALQHDPKMIALAKSLAAELLTASGHMEDVLIYYRIDQLPEELVDILAYDMHVDWYSYEAPLAVKRQTVKDSVKVHKYMGTKYAVETAMQALLQEAEVKEWFDYEGEPHHFRIYAPLDHHVFQLAELEQMVKIIFHVKRLSSWLDEIIFTFAPVTAMLRVGGKTGAHAWIGIPLGPDSYDFKKVLHIGGDFGAEELMKIPEGQDAFNFRETLHAGGRFSGETGFSVPEDTRTAQVSAAIQAGGTFSTETAIQLAEDTERLPATTIVRTGGVCTIISNISKEG